MEKTAENRPFRGIPVFPDVIYFAKTLVEAGQVPADSVSFPRGFETMAAKKTATKKTAGTTRKTSSTASKSKKTTTARTSASKTSPATATKAKAAPKKPAVKLSSAQEAMLKKIDETAEPGYVPAQKVELRTIEKLREHKLVKRGAKDKESGFNYYMATVAGKKLLSGG